MPMERNLLKLYRQDLEMNDVQLKQFIYVC